MKKYFKYSYYIVAVCCVLFSMCGKKMVERTAHLSALQPADQDINAGLWKPVLLSRPDTFSVAAPAAVGSTAYLADLNEMKGYQSHISEDDQEKIEYWSAGGVLRWNELMRQLVAKYNLPPYQNEDGTYPIPSSANPFAYPLFPFANPPYAARAYAYIAAAQYDALVACWHYKKLYNRPAAYVSDAAVKSLVPRSSLPSYPSEAAVLAGVTAEMMKLFFPTEIAYIQEKAVEQETSAIRSGSALRSDVIAGENLGRQVAQLFISRARTDNASKAVGTPTDWANLESTTTARGEIPWISLESPKRPPMLPLFGKVSPFLFESATVATLRPGPPPSTGSEQMKKETEEVYNFVKNQKNANQRIVLYWADGVGTYTPPGHWNAIACEDFIKKNYSEVRWSRNLALLNMSLMDAGIVCWDTKYYYFNPRPSQLNLAIKTFTGIPNFPAYISGHSTFSGAAATILGQLVPERAEAYNAMASEASLSRLIGGIHYRTDCEVGLRVGKNVGQFAVTRAKTDGAQ